MPAGPQLATKTLEGPRVSRIKVEVEDCLRIRQAMLGELVIEPARTALFMLVVVDRKGEASFMQACTYFPG